MSIFTRITPFLFFSFFCYGTAFAQPANNECAAAVVLTPQPYTASGCAGGVAGTTVGATKSTVPASASFGTSSDDDVWYQFTATSTGHVVRFCNVTFPTGAVVPMNVALHPVGCTAASTQITGTNLAIVVSTGEGSGAFTGLTVGATYSLRVLTNGTTSRANFTVSILSPPAVPDCVTLVSPANGATNVPLLNNPLTWTNPSTGGPAASYKIYFGTTTPPVLLGTISNPGATNVTITGEAYNTTYYWYVVPSNAGGDAVGCNATIFSYTTGSAPAAPANDLCPNATNLTPTAGVYTDPGLQSTESATNTGAPDAGCALGASLSDFDVWYKFTTGATGGTQIFNITPSLATDIVAIGYTTPGACSGASICADASGASATPEVLNFTGLAANSTYIFRVYGYTATATAPYGFNFTISSVSGVLPVLLKSFTGMVQDKGNLLSWETLEEQNIAYYSIERSVDAAHWVETGRVTVKENTATAQNYSLMDATPAAKGWYRLRTVDLDGKDRYSNTVLLTRKVSDFGISYLYPSPAGDHINLQFNSVTTEKVTVRIIDLTGRPVKEITVASSGNTTSLPISLRGLPAGTYMVSLSNGTGVSAPVKFVKL